jgi:hypothetical protein
MARLRVQEVARARGMNLSQLLAAVNRRIPRGEKPVAMGTMRRYWYSTKDGRETGEPIELADLHLLGTIARVLEVPLPDLLNEEELGNSQPARLAWA